MSEVKVKRGRGRPRNGEEPKPSYRRPKQISGSAKDIALAAMVANGTPLKRARGALGMVESHNAMTETQQELVTTMRAELQRRPGMQLVDSADFYRDASEGKKEINSDRLKARERLDKILGYDAPARLDVHETHETTMAVAVLHRLVDSGVSLADVKAKIRMRAAEAAEVVDG